MAKLKLNEDRFGAKDMYREFKKKNPETDITYPLYRTILEKFNVKVADRILEGEVFNLGHRLGYIYIKKIRRTPTSKSIDWKETHKMWEEQGNREGFVYYTDDHYYRWNWEKRKALVKNKSVYKFEPTGGKLGLKKKLVERLRSNPFAATNYHK
tara:strand:- start:715 stop:1176 length:462 start_codon:yes stop_codon:yes gene_type:complete